MKKNANTDFFSLVDNDEFVLLVRKHSWTDKQVSIFVNQFPGNEETLKYAFLFLKSTFSQQTQLPNEDSIAIRIFIRNYRIIGFVGNKENKEGSFFAMKWLNVNNPVRSVGKTRTTQKSPERV